MTCFHPIRGWRQGDGTVKFVAGDTSSRVAIPCGQCIGCREDRTREWTLRIMHESTLHEKNCFLTLTYSDEYVPEDGCLRKKDWQNFAKAVRRYTHDVAEATNTYRDTFRYFHCGEYGDEYGRPHYHAAVFGLDFALDRYQWTMNGPFPVWRSPALDKLWRHGYATIGELTHETAAYVAGYVQKKITGINAKRHYERLGLTPEYSTMSRKPGIGKGWYEKNATDVINQDQVIYKGFPVRPPRYYDKFSKKLDEHRHSLIKLKRIEKAPTFTKRQLKAKETILRERRKRKERNYERGEDTRFLERHYSTDYRHIHGVKPHEEDAI